MLLLILKFSFLAIVIFYEENQYVNLSFDFNPTYHLICREEVEYETNNINKHENVIQEHVTLHHSKQGNIASIFYFLSTSNLK